MTHTTLKGSYRAKQRRTHNQTLWRKLNREREFNKTQGYAFAFIVLLGLGLLGGVILANGPLFHNTVSNHSFNTHDPIKPLWYDCIPNLILWNTLQASFSSQGVNACTGAQFGNTIVLTPNSTTPAIALYKNVIPIDQASSKVLEFDMLIAEGGSGNRITQSMIYLTRNSTLPTTNANSYSPLTDRNVAFAILRTNNAGNTAGTLQTFIQSDVTKSIADTNPSNCTGRSGSLFSCMVWGVTPVNQINQISEQLNFTGATLTSSTSSFFFLSCAGAPCTNIASTTETRLPQLSLTGPYYLGIFAIATLTPAATSYYGSFEPVNNNPCCALNMNSMSFSIYTPNPTGAQPLPFIDTGGFFGPIIRFFIQAGVFILSNIISFFSYLYGLVVPILAGLAGIIGGFLVGILNAFGNIFGDNHLGTDINTAFTQITSYFAQVFTSAASIWGNILTTLLNFVTFITKFFVGNPFIAFIENFIAQAPNIWVVFSGVWADIMQYYISGVFTIQTVLVFWYLFGMYEVYMHGVSGFKDWLHTSELGIFGIFKAGYWLIDEAYNFVVQLKQLLFGNTVSPVKVAGTG